MDRKDSRSQFQWLHQFHRCNRIRVARNKAILRPFLAIVPGIHSPRRIPGAPVPPAHGVAPHQTGSEPIPLLSITTQSSWAVADIARPWVCRLSNCPYSGGFKLYQNLTTHVRISIIHQDELKNKPPERYRCQWFNCTESFGNLKSRNEHQDQEHETDEMKKGRETAQRNWGKPWLCKYSNCSHTDATFGQREGVQEHVTIFHHGVADRSTHVCRWFNCNKTFKDAKTQADHETQNHDNTEFQASRKFKCRFCGRMYRYNRDLRVHVNSQHQEEIEAEEGQRRPPPEQPESYATGTPTEPWICRVKNQPSCYQYSSKSTLARHRLSVHRGTDDDHFLCRYCTCDVVSADFATREKHEDSHMEAKPILCRLEGCTEVPRGFDNLDARQNHEDTRHPTRVYCQAPKCGFFFVTEKAKDGHQKAAHKGLAKTSYPLGEPSAGRASVPKAKQPIQDEGSPYRELIRGTEAMGVGGNTVTAPVRPSYSKNSPPWKGTQLLRSNSPDTHVQFDPNRKSPPKDYGSKAQGFGSRNTNPLAQAASTHTPSAASRHTSVANTLNLRPTGPPQVPSSSTSIPQDSEKGKEVAHTVSETQPSDEQHYSTDQRARRVRAHGSDTAYVRALKEGNATASIQPDTSISRRREARGTGHIQQSEHAEGIARAHPYSISASLYSQTRPGPTQGHPSESALAPAQRSDSGTSTGGGLLYPADRPSQTQRLPSGPAPAAAQSSAPGRAGTTHARESPDEPESSRPSKEARKDTTQTSGRGFKHDVRKDKGKDTRSGGGRR